MIIEKRIKAFQNRILLMTYIVVIFHIGGNKPRFIIHSNNIIKSIVIIIIMD